MLSVAAMGSGQGEYYLGLTEEYYAACGEPEGRWIGRGAERLGLTGTVEAERFRNLLAGRSPDGQGSLTGKGNGHGHRPGYDLTFSAPKSFSALWAVSGPSRQSLLESIHTRAVKTAISYIEDTAAYTRRGKGGAKLERVGLVVAAFEHGSSRSLDPQMHTHALVMNVAPRADGTTGTIESFPLFRHKMDAGAIYRAELAALLAGELGLDCVPDGTSFRIEGVPQELCQAFSRRREQILEALDRRGAQGARAAATAALDTRAAKVSVSHERLLAQWQAVGRGYGFARDRADRLKGGQVRYPSVSPETVARMAAGEITQRQSCFAQRELVRRIAELAPACGMDAAAVRSAAAAYLRSPEAVRLGPPAPEAIYTTREMLDLEEGMLACARRLRIGAFHRLKEETLQAVIAERPRLGYEQQNALRHIARKPGNIHVISGLAGTGKTSLAEAMRLCFEREGYRVVGAAPSAKAARGLREGAGIRSDTLHRTLFDLGQPDCGLSPKSVFVLDEAGMVGTRQMAELLGIVEKAGANLVLIGDARQLQPIDAGGAFAALGAELGQAELTRIARQHEKWQRAAVVSMAEGDAAAALGAYADHGQVRIEEDRIGAMRALIADWRKEDALPEKDRLIFAATNRDVGLLNLLAQRARQEDGALGQRQAAVGDVTVFENDRVLFVRNDRVRGVQNGSLGTVSSIGSGIVAVRLDSGAVVSFPAEAYRHLRLGYAVTTHKGQGVTVERASVLLGADMQDRELSYVQLSRSRAGTTLYADHDSAGEELADLVRRMGVSHRKELALDTLSRQGQALSLAR
jgi:conjugative relaxase-like TrwC/TraI family protein